MSLNFPPAGWIRCLLGVFLLSASPVYAMDSYRYAHVTIETPWLIFLFLLLVILLPFIVMAFLHWKHALQKDARDDEHDR